MKHEYILTCAARQGRSIHADTRFGLPGNRSRPCLSLGQDPPPDRQPDRVDAAAGHEGEVRCGDPRVAVRLDGSPHLRGDILHARRLHKDMLLRKGSGRARLTVG